MRLPQILIAVALGLAGSLSGCAAGAGAPNVAATVGSVVVTEAQVSSSADAFIKVMTEIAPQLNSSADPGEGVRATMVSYFVRGLIADALAAQHGFVITPDVRAARAAEYIDAEALYADPGTRDMIAGAIDFMLVAETLTQQGVDADTINAELTALDVQLNPRYGTWDESALVASAINTPPPGLGTPLGRPNEP